MTFGFATRIALLMAVILGTGVAATGGLSVHKFERTLADFLASRFEFVVSDIRQRIETQMDLGLALSGLQGVSERLEGYIRADQQILSIEVFDDTGAVLFSTDPSFVGDLVAEEWMIAWRTSRGRDVWSDLERDAGVVGAPLRNNLDQDVGSLALRYSRDFLDRSVTAQASRLLVIAAMAAVGMTVISILGTILLLRRSNRELTHLNAAMNDVMERAPDGRALDWARQQHPEFAAFSGSALAAYESIDAATADVRRLDEEGAE